MSPESAVAIPGAVDALTNVVGKAKNHTAYGKLKEGLGFVKKATDALHENHPIIPEAERLFHAKNGEAYVVHFSHARRRDDGKP